MSNNKRKSDKLGSFMCKLLRHTPNENDLTIDEYGYCDLEDLLKTIKANSYWSGVTKEELLMIVETCKKQRYSVQGNRIKANYGHSIPVIQEYKERLLPPILIHGTNEKAIEFILSNREGIKSMNRQFVHLSESTSFAELAAKRRPNPLLLEVNTEIAKEMGVEFHYAGNEVWLSTGIPVEAVERRKDA